MSTCGRRNPFLGTWMSDQQGHGAPYVQETIPFFYLSHNLKEKLPEQSETSHSVQAHLFRNQQCTCFGREGLGRNGRISKCAGWPQRLCNMLFSTPMKSTFELKKSEGLQRLPGWSAISTCTKSSHPVRWMCSFLCKMPWKINKGRVCAVPGIPSSMCALLFP